MSLDRGPLSLVSTIEKLLGRKSSDSGLENLEYGRRDPSSVCDGKHYWEEEAEEEEKGKEGKKMLVKKKEKNLNSKMKDMKLSVANNPQHDNLTNFLQKHSLLRHNCRPLQAIISEKKFT
jgi:hypothetical protein